MGWHSEDGVNGRAAGTDGRGLGAAEAMREIKGRLHESVRIGPNA